MQFAELNISLNQDELRTYINDQLNSAIAKTLFTWDIDEMSKRTCMSKSF